MSKKIITLALVAALLCSFGQLVFAPGNREGPTNY